MQSSPKPSIQNKTAYFGPLKLETLHLSISKLPYSQKLGLELTTSYV